MKTPHNSKKYAIKHTGLTPDSTKATRKKKANNRKKEKNLNGRKPNT